MREMSRMRQASYMSLVVERNDIGECLAGKLAEKRAANFRDRFLRVFQLMLPKSYNAPAFASQLLCLSFIAGAIKSDLLLPVFNIGAGHTQVQRTAMPVATI